MNADTTLYIRGEDKLSPSLKAAMNSGKDLRKEMEEGAQTIENLHKKQNALRDNIAKQAPVVEDWRKAVAEAKKEYKKLGDELTRTNLEKAEKGFADATASVKDYQYELNRTTQGVREFEREQSRMQNRVSDSTLAGLGQSLGIQMLGKSISGMASTLFSSSMGTQAGDFYSTMLGDMASGAAIGSMMGPLGTAIGAGAGLLSGAISGATGVFKAEEDYFISDRNQTAEGMWAEDERALRSGSEIAAQRERDQKGFEGVLGVEGANEFVNTLIQRDATNPMEYADMTRLSNTLFGYGNTAGEALHMLDIVGDVGAARGLEIQDMEMITDTIARLEFMPRATQVEINKLVQRGVPALEYLGRGMDMSRDQIFAALSSGQISGAEAQRVIMEGIANDPQFMGAMDGLGDTYYGARDMAEARQLSLDVARGTGFNAEAAKGLAYEEEVFGEVGADLEDLNYQIGVFEGSLENLERKLGIDALNAVVTGAVAPDMLNYFDPAAMTNLASLGDEYAKAKANEDAVEMGRIARLARYEGEMAFMQTEGYLQMADAEIQLVQNVTDALIRTGVYHQAGYDLSEEMGKGFISGFTDTVGKGLASVEFGTGGDGNIYVIPPKIDGSHATGLPYVPFDGYTAELHAGERVLTANENNDYSGGKRGAVNVTIGDIYSGGDSEETANLVAQKVVEAIQLLY